MKAPVVACLLVSLAASIPCFAQGRAGGRGNGNANVSTLPLPGGDQPLSVPTVFISGKVAIDDGTLLTEPAAIQSICKGRRHTETFTDRHGSFSFQFGDPSPAAGVDFTDASNSMMNRTESIQQQHNWQECEVQAVLGGFSSEVVELASRMNTLESTDIGRLVLHRLAQVEGTSISVTSAQAPTAARKGLEKGREAEKKAKWDQAAKSLQKAVDLYPKYAVAWFELGRVQLVKNDIAAAKKSFEQSIAADPKYVNPYNGLAELAFMASQWNEVVKITNKLLALNPVNFPGAYFFSGAANYYLRNMDAGEKSARQGIKVDEGHQIPKLQYLLSLILVQKHAYAEAVEHMQAYLKMATNSADIDSAKKQLDQIARLAAVPSTAAAVPTTK